MFTGIVECTGTVKSLHRSGSNMEIALQSSISKELKTDQSVAHNGVCLTVEEVKGDTHRVTAISESLRRSNLGSLREGDKVNLERCLKVGGRMDGHWVQGHVDITAICRKIRNKDGSWIMDFEHRPSGSGFNVDKGSITVNGVSLTVVEAGEDHFSIAVIPYTYEHSNLGELKVGSEVNVEFDILGKYIEELYRRSGEK